MNSKILVLGIGNLLMGDEGIGIHIIREFEKVNPYKNLVDVVDGGTGGFHLLSYFQDYKKIIIVDAAIGDKPAGTVELIKPKYSSDFPKTLTAHDIGLKDLIDSASILGELPEIKLIIVYIDKFHELDLHLSEKIRSIIPEVVKLITKAIEEYIN
ncbi:MAG: hydrogenase maturation protease [Ignavibacteria bacterium]|jgi:hydrogenase maturation protease|nr:hydrogenase maturation protease [Ignavibacteria bacterium]MDH7527636.1 hydrogenase maturation protease [Ignavibacteria bacterium]NPV12193.1 hydrogenase maturation protease [Ignavibacteria bacterium]